MDPLARHLQFLTNEFDRDFNYIGAFDIRGKVIIYGHVESRIRFYELIIQRQTSTFEPGTDDTTLSVQLLRRRSVTFNQFEDVSKIFVMENLENKLNKGKHPTLFVGVSMNNEFKNVSVFTIPARAIIYGLHGKLDSKEEPYKGYASMLSGVFLARSDRENLPVVGNYIVVAHDFQQQYWSWDMLPLVTSLLKGYTTRVWMNPYRFHRRMAYPHTRHRAIRYHVAEGWLKFLPLLIGTQA
ncbi:unnamed protein product [Nippostrongylus brasiliensis]|uniref:Uncharacterized protein n=1 Tax=Nippostrongylus brasiliensis TaxID=27835 RepID=A0A0N4YT77_NIPBR|nr:unnamed protein product [Nippostrongylus brasiliensis]